MKIGTGKVIRVSTNLVRVMKDYYRLVLLISLFIAGMLIGALTFKNSGSNISTLLTDMVIKQSAERTSQAAIVTFINSLLVNAAFVGIAFTMGMCCIGTPFIGLLPLIKGLGLGMVAGYFYNNDVAGILYYLLIILPGAVISTVALIISCGESIRMSGEMLKVVSSKKSASPDGIKTYMSRYIIIVVLILISSVMDMFLTKAFSFLF
ncbi:MAG: stage II sporulation protein M [Acutalibacteraceae bacterium]|jgi:uncharacterized membrane protein SpoIIM required for sporulation